MSAGLTPSTEKRGRRFYLIEPNEDGTVDVLLNPQSNPMTTEDGFTDYMFTAIVVRGIVPFDGIEEDIRARFQAWCESGEEISI